MPIDQTLLPENSLLKHWLKANSIIEPPVSYDLAVGLSTIGAALRRDAWVEQELWRVYPNLSILLVGKSGLGKDTSINQGAKVLETLACAKIVGGKTSEAVMDSLQKIGDPAVGVILAKEFSEFFGPKDYQKGMLQAITDLLSTGDMIDMSLKSKQKSYIRNPTVTMMGGSTKEWLHQAMPDSAVTGGFYPRFLIFCETEPKRHVALIKHSLKKQELIEAFKARDAFVSGLKEMLYFSKNLGEVKFSNPAIDLYEGWYKSRLQKFSMLAEAYANRSRDTVLRVALICAVADSRDTMSEADMLFAISVMDHVAATIDEAIAPPTTHLRILRDVLKLLPATREYLQRQLENKYDPWHIRTTIDSMINDSKRMVWNDREKFYYNSDQAEYREVHS